MVFVAISHNVCAQNRFEVSLGVNLASLEKSEDRFLGGFADANWRTALNAGIRYSIPHRNWRFGTGIGLSVKGEKGYLEKKHSRPYYVTDIKYIEVPLSVTRVIKSKYLITAGTLGGFAIQRQVKGYVVGDPVRKDRRAYRLFDVGVQSAIGYTFGERFTVCLAYGFSFLDIGLEPRYNRFFNLNINYLLDFSKN